MWKYNDTHTSKEREFLYYRCTAVNHTTKEACKIKSAPAKELENAVIYKIKQLSQNDTELREAIEKANREYVESSTSLLKEKSKYESNLKSLNKSIRQFLNTIEKENVQIKFIEDELKELDRKKIFYEDKIEEIKKQVEHYRNNLIDFNKMKENLSFIAEGIDAFEPKLKKNILRLFIERVTFYKEKIRISLRDLTSTGLSFGAEPNLWFDKIQQWLPNWIIDRTFTCVFLFEPKLPKEGKSPHYYRNPICLAKDYKRMIDSEEVKNQSDLARKLGVSRVRISQVLSLLKLDVKIIEAVEKLGDPMPKRYISERKLRSLVKLTNERQRATFQSIIPLKKISCTTVR